MNVLWNNCFLCGSPVLGNHKKKIKFKKGEKEFLKPSHYLLLKYLLNGSRSSCSKMKGEEVGLLYNDVMKFVKVEEGHVQFCRFCDNICEDIGKLQVELEVVQMKIVDKLQSVKQVVITNSRVYGCNAGVKEDLKGFEAGLEERERCGMDCKGGRDFLDILHRFQDFVFENDLRRLHIPLVYIEKYTGNVRVQLGGVLEADVNVKGKEAIVKQELEDANLDSTNPDVDDFPSIPSPVEDNMMDETEVKIGSIPISIPTIPEETDGKRKRGRKAKPSPVTKIEEETKRRSRRKSVSDASQRSKKMQEMKQKRKKAKQVKGKTQAQLLARQMHQARLAKEGKPAMRLPKGYRKRLYCDSCTFATLTAPQLEAHLREHENPEEKNHTCPDCQETFTKQQMFEIHLLQHSFRHKCDVCELRFLPVEMEMHLKTHGDSIFRCHLCNYVFGTYPGLIFHTKFHPKGMELKCNLCPTTPERRVYTRRHELLEHLHNSHDGYSDLKIKCQEPNCPETFFDPGQLKNHMNIHNKRFSCPDPVCAKPFISKNAMEIHYRRFHFNEKPFQCDLCPKKYDNKYGLRDHKISKHGFPKLKCEICVGHPGFINQSNLSMHMRAVHGMGKAAHYPCSKCDKVFLTNKELRRHEFVHSETKDFTCEVCGFATTAKHLLGSHMKKHNGEKKFACTYCPKTFVYPRYLRDHLRTHTLERPFQCETCGQSFSQRGSLNIHTKKHVENGSKFLSQGHYLLKEEHE